jgi:hypothetical protein
MEKTPVKVSYTWLYFVLAIILVLGITCALSNCHGGTAMSDNQKAFYACQSFIETQLKDPGSVQWPDYSEEDVVYTGGQYVVLMDGVRAKNSFGALVLANYTCTTHNVGSDNWYVQMQEH